MRRARKFPPFSWHRETKFWFRVACDTQKRLRQMDQSAKDSNASHASASPSIEVDRLPTPTVAPHGMTGSELNRLSGAVRFMELHRKPKRGLWGVHTNKATPRSIISNIQKRISRL